MSRTTPSSRAATARSSSSPTPWPSVSLIDLKLSRSMNSAATGAWLRRARTSICSTRSRISVRLGRPSARRGSRGRRAPPGGASAPRARAGARTRRTGTSARASRRGCAAACRAPRRAPARGISSCAAVSRRTSSAASRQRRQRLVTSFSGASRWAASWPKIRQDSWPTSRATSAPSPAIQRATAIVETVPTRTKLSSTTASSVGPESAERLRIPATTSSVRALSASPSRRSCAGSTAAAIAAGAARVGSDPSVSPIVDLCDLLHLSLTHGRGDRQIVRVALTFA